MESTPTYRALGVEDLGLMRQLIELFHVAFERMESAASEEPNDAYLKSLLQSDRFLAMVAIVENVVVGGLTGYFLPKLESARTEFYVYDLAVEEGFRRRGIATGLLINLHEYCDKRGVDVLYVQADAEDTEAVRLYSKFGNPREVFHFEIGSLRDQ